MYFDMSIWQTAYSFQFLRNGIYWRKYIDKKTGGDYNLNIVESSLSLSQHSGSLCQGDHILIYFIDKR